MTKDILIISTSLRKGSNSELLAGEFAKGARDAGHRVEEISLRDKDIQFCKGCLACQKTQRCVIRDDADAIVRRMFAVATVVFATPIYFYEMAGQMKTLLDRTNPLFPSDYAFRDIYLLAAAGDTDQNAVDGTINGLNEWIRCFGKARLKGVFRGSGLEGPQAAANMPELLRSAYEMGRNV